MTSPSTEPTQPTAALPINLNAAEIHHIAPNAAPGAAPAADLTINIGPKPEVQLESLRDLWRRDRAEGERVFDAYFENMLKHFPPEEMAARSEFIAALDSGTYDIQIMKVGGKVAGGLHQWEIEVPGNGMVIAIPFVWVEPEARGQGHGTTLANMGREIVKQSSAWAQIAEVNDAHLMTGSEKNADGGEDIAARRQEYWKRLGWKTLDMAYIQPNLDLESADSKPVTYVGMLIDVLRTPPQAEALQQTAEGPKISRELGLAMIQAYIDNISSYDGGAVNDPSFHVIEQDARKGPEWVNLIDPTKPRQNLHADFTDYRRTHQTV